MWNETALWDRYLHLEEKFHRWRIFLNRSVVQLNFFTVTSSFQRSFVEIAVIIAANTPKLKLFAQARAASSTFTTHTFFHVAEAPAGTSCSWDYFWIARRAAKVQLQQLEAATRVVPFRPPQADQYPARQAGRMAWCRLECRRPRARRRTFINSLHNIHSLLRERHPAAQRNKTAEQVSKLPHTRALSPVRNLLLS